jgi:hypothetical protein
MRYSDEATKTLSDDGETLTEGEALPIGISGDIQSTDRMAVSTIIFSLPNKTNRI